MSVYIWTKHTASETGTRLVEVRCAQCDVTYFYELRREGSGIECSAYFLFEDWARETAVAKARQDAERRIASEAELVPCPACNWINEELIEGYRRSCYRGWIERSIWTMVIGMGICAVSVSVTVGIPGHSDEFILFAVIVPFLLILAVAGVVLFVRTMRKNIDPNSQFPKPPRLPKNVPAALVLDRESGQLVPSSQKARGTGAVPG